MSRNYWMAALAVLFTAASLNAQQPEPRPRVISVSAAGTVQRQPDRGVVMVAVESRAPAAQDASQANAKKMDAVFSTLRKLGITTPHVQTISYSLEPEYRQPDPRTANPDRPTIVGYTARNMIRVEVDSVPRVGAIIDAVIAAGANRIDGLSFELRDPEAARLEALRIAVDRAHAEADVLATAAGQRLGPPQSISTGYVAPPQPMYRMAAGMAADAVAPTPVEPGNLSITANVSITYLIGDR